MDEPGSRDARLIRGESHLMSWIGDFFQWFAGGTYRYHDLAHCMKGDVLWIAITVALDFAVAAGYVVIAIHWRRNERLLPKSPAKTALGNMKAIKAEARRRMTKA